jgi:hypothetical protein
MHSSIVGPDWQNSWKAISFISGAVQGHTLGKTMQLLTRVSGAKVTSVADISLSLSECSPSTVTLIRPLRSCSGSGSPSTLAHVPMWQLVPTIEFSTQECFSKVEPSMMIASLTRTPSST